MQNNYPHFSDFSDDTKPFAGDKKKINDILNQKILILDFKIKDSKQRSNTSYATIQFKLNDLKYIFFSGSNVIIEQLSKYKDNLPFYTTIIKIDRYYTFS